MYIYISIYLYIYIPIYLYLYIYMYTLLHAERKGAAHVEGGRLWALKPKVPVQHYQGIIRRIGYSYNKRG